MQPEHHRVRAQKGRKRHEDKKEESLRFWQLPCPQESASPELLLAWSFPVTWVCVKWCSFASVAEFTLAYHLPTIKNPRSVLSLGEGVPKLTFVFLFSCRMFIYRPDCMQMVYQ